MTKEVNFLFGKFTLGELSIKLVLSEDPQHNLQMFQVTFLILAVDENVIKVDYDKII
jgi:hypothetical protein